jgi:hypothetical protein
VTWLNLADDIAEMFSMMPVPDVWDWDNLQVIEADVSVHEARLANIAKANAANARRAEARKAGQKREDYNASRRQARADARAAVRRQWLEDLKAANRARKAARKAAAK